MRRLAGIGVGLVLLLVTPSGAQHMELSNPEMSDFGSEGQAADLGNDMADRAVIDGSGQAADLGNDIDERALIDGSGQAADLGNDTVDRAVNTDESQEADLEGY